MIKLLILDIDGILTDGKKTYDINGNVISKNFCDKDWTAIKRFKSLDIEVIFLTGDPFNYKIASNRGIKTIVNRSPEMHRDKSEYIDEICQTYKVNIDEVAFAGDDIFDLNLMLKLHNKYCPLDAPAIIKNNATIIPCNGGDNFVMKLFDFLYDNNKIPKFNINDHINKIYYLDMRDKF